MPLLATTESPWHSIFVNLNATRAETKFDRISNNGVNLNVL